MGLITTEVTLKPKGKAAAYYRGLGYSWEKGDSITVPISDLQKHSNMIVKCICDYCGREFETNYNIYNRSKDCVVSKISCVNCASLKQSDVLKKIYGVSNVSQLPEVKQKKIETNYARYGTLYTCTEECKQKVIQTDMRKYGVPHHSLDEGVKQKAAATNIARYGSENPFGSLEIQEKIKSTLKEKYGTPYASQSPVVRKKMIDSLYKNQSVMTSAQQKYIAQLFGFPLNYGICYWNVDMYDESNKTVWEYDGGGHRLSVITGRMSAEDFDQRELIRNAVIRRDGHKMSRIISRKDYLPSDDILLQILSYARQYFSDYPNHSWIEFDIDNGIVRNAENKNGVIFNYGELRKIKKSNLDVA